MQYVAFLKHVSMDDGFRSEEVRCSWGRYPMGVPDSSRSLAWGQGVILPFATILYRPLPPNSRFLKWNLMIIRVFF